MADIKTFYLPDLGEGLPDATIVEWHVKEGDYIKLDAEPGPARVHRPDGPAAAAPAPLLRAHDGLRIPA